MTIAYDYMHEAWRDDKRDDKDFYVSMSPEGDPKELEYSFESEKEFWEWYKS